MHRLRTREAFHAAGHGSGRRLVSEMQRRLASGVLAHYAAHCAQSSSACWTTNFVASSCYRFRSVAIGKPGRSFTRVTAANWGEGGLEVFMI
jgi:hypothetical protein